MIVSNSIRCKLCGDEIFSAHRHDFVTCKCGAVSTDGGCEYIRWVGDLHFIEDLSITMPREVVDACIEAWERCGNFLYVCGELRASGYDIRHTKKIEWAAKDAVRRGEQNNRNSRGIVYAIFRALRDCGVDMNKVKDVDNVQK